MDRYWLLTSTFYGNWLPGDPRGFVGRVHDARPDDPLTITRLKHNIPGTPYDEDLPGLYEASQQLLKGPPIRIDQEQAEVLLKQFQETAACRHWQPLAIALMVNHFHIVVGVPGDPAPTKILGDFKSYGSRALNQRWGKPPSATWWTYAGSKRKLADAPAIHDAVEYVRTQLYALIIWVAPEWRAGLG